VSHSHTSADHADNMMEGGAVAVGVGDCNSADRTISPEMDDEDDAAADAAEDTPAGDDAAWVDEAD
jgi:hypothetical protein